MIKGLVNNKIITLNYIIMPFEIKIFGSHYKSYLLFHVNAFCGSTGLFGIYERKERYNKLQNWNFIKYSILLKLTSTIN